MPGLRSRTVTTITTIIVVGWTTNLTSLRFDPIRWRHQAPIRIVCSLPSPTISTEVGLIGSTDPTGSPNKRIQPTTRMPSLPSCSSTTMRTLHCRKFSLYLNSAWVETSLHNDNGHATITRIKEITSLVYSSLKNLNQTFLAFCSQIISSIQTKNLFLSNAFYSISELRTPFN